MTPLSSVVTSTEGSTSIGLDGQQEDQRIPHPSEEASDNSAAVATINHIAYNYVALFIVALGIVGNLLNLIVLTRPKLKGTVPIFFHGLRVT